MSILEFVSIISLFLLIFITTFHILPIFNSIVHFLNIKIALSKYGFGFLEIKAIFFQFSFFSIINVPSLKSNSNL